MCKEWAGIIKVWTCMTSHALLITCMHRSSLVNDLHNYMLILVVLILLDLLPLLFCA